MTTPKKHYWFPAKSHGWGWGLPATWQGWTALLLFVVVVSLSAFIFDPAESLVAFSLFNVLAAAVLLFVCLAKGEPAQWRWGKKGS